MDEVPHTTSPSEGELARLRAENESLRSQLEDAQETLRAIRAGEVDALVVSTPQGERIFTLQGGEHPYRALIEQMREGAATLTPEGLIHYCNGRFAEMLQLPLEQVMGGRIEEFVAPADRALLAVMLCEGGGRAELALRTRDAGEMPALVSAICLRTEGPAAICLVVADLTERKRTEAEIRQLNEELEQRVVQRTAALRESEERYRTLFDTMTEGFALHEIITDDQGRPCDYRFLDVNPSFERLTGLKRADLLGKRVCEVMPATESYWIETYGKVALTGEPIHVENYSSALARWYDVFAYRTAIGHFAVIFSDITERKRAEEALASTHRQVQSIIDNTTAIIYAFDLEGRFLLANATVAELLGSTPEQMIGKRRHEFMPRDDADWHEANDRQAIEAGRATEFEEYSQLQGRSITWLTTKFPLRDAQGRIYAVAGISADVSERKRAEEELRAAKASAEAANVAKGRFLANISHELRTPMNAILGMVDLALPKQTDPAAADFLTTARGSADLLLALLNDLLDAAKIEAGKMELESAPFSLRHVLDQTTQVLGVRASEKGLSFSCRVPPEVPNALVGDQVRLRQILLNLAGNAIKFTEKGQVTISVRVTDLPSPSGRGAGGEGGVESSSPLKSPPHPGPLPEGEGNVTLEFAVHDTGIGIPTADIPRIFDPFAQADTSTTRRFGGTGLGLSICSNLVGLMGGRIWAESELGKGSTFSFTVRLPLAAELPPEPAKPEVSAAATAKLHILLAEDNPANQKLVAYVLKDRGHAIDVVGDGQQALRMIQENCYDVVLMDVQMPGMDGLEATQAIRANEPAGRRVPIIAMTAHAMKGDRERCLAAGMDGYLAKPIDGHEMIALVETLGAGTSSAPPQTGAGPAIPIFDPALALQRCYNRPKLVRDLIEGFFAEYDDMLPQIRAALAAGDLAEAGSLGHRLKGTLVFLGAEPARAAAERVERFHRGGGERAEAEEALRMLEHECALLKAALQAHQVPASQ